jgi:hypothetical protein
MEIMLKYSLPIARFSHQRLVNITRRKEVLTFYVNTVQKIILDGPPTDGALYTDITTVSLPTFLLFGVAFLAALIGFTLLLPYITGANSIDFHEDE